MTSPKTAWPKPLADRYSLIDFYGPLNGSGWHLPEIQDGITFRWSTDRAELAVPLLRGAYAGFSLYACNFINPTCIETLRIHLDGRELEWSCDVRHFGAVIRFAQRDPAVSRFGRLVLEIESELEPNGDRQLGLAANRLDIVFHAGELPSPTLCPAPAEGGEGRATP